MVDSTVGGSWGGGGLSPGRSVLRAAPGLGKERGSGGAPPAPGGGGLVASVRPRRLSSGASRRRARPGRDVPELTRSTGAENGLDSRRELRVSCVRGVPRRGGLIEATPRNGRTRVCGARWPFYSTFCCLFRRKVERVRGPARTGRCVRPSVAYSDERSNASGLRPPPAVVFDLVLAMQTKGRTLGNIPVASPPPGVARAPRATTSSPSPWRRPRDHKPAAQPGPHRTIVAAAAPPDLRIALDPRQPRLLSVHGCRGAAWSLSSE
jgi:hypothetical protein